jgi:ribokinase
VPPRVAVIGHVEWVTFAHGEPPGRGQIATARSLFALPAGGGAITAVECARLGARTRLYTALGTDAAAETARAFLAERGVEVVAAVREAAQTAALALLHADGERTIVVVGDNLQPAVDDPLPWHELAAVDAVCFTADDPGLLARARAAPVLVVTARRPGAIAASGVAVDVVVGSAHDAAEELPPAGLPVAPGAVVTTHGADGGTYALRDGRAGSYAPAVPPGPFVDAFGAGDCFLAGLTVALACGDVLPAALARRGPYAAA